MGLGKWLRGEITGCSSQRARVPFLALTWHPNHLEFQFQEIQHLLASVVT